MGALMSPPRSSGASDRVDVVAPRMPQPAAARGIEPLGDGAGGGRILAQQESAHRRVAEIGVVHEIDQRARHRVGGLGEIDQPVDRLGKLGGAARAVAHLARR